MTQNSAFYCAKMLIANPPPATEFNFKTDLLVSGTPSTSYAVFVLYNDIRIINSRCVSNTVFI